MPFLFGFIDKGGKEFWSLSDDRDVACEAIWSLASRSGGKISEFLTKEG